MTSSLQPSAFSLHPLVPELRNKLERTIIEARDVAEAGAKAALEALAVHHHEPYGHMSPGERKLRNHLRARARQLGDKQNRKGELEITHLVWECAYEHWHRMLFARFLAENDLLIEPEMGVAISLEECEELAKEEGKDLWTLASEFAQRMLPQIFRPNDPVLKVSLAREHRIRLENLLDELEPAIFTASDSLGWVYQFWQSKRKNEVNQSGNKIGADELPAVTQLFTEPYMVSFLLDNSLGAWWAGKRLKEEGGRRKEEWEKCRTEADCRRLLALPGVTWDYLRFVKPEQKAESEVSSFIPHHSSFIPAAGTFDGWPKDLGELKVLDPCCGSGHFLVAAFLLLVPMRMELEGLSAREAVDAVLRENLHGLEIDPRCVELAVFALALAAWRYPDAGGYRPLPELNVACSGLAISAGREEWQQLASGNHNLKIALGLMHDTFKEAPALGSLLDPLRTEAARIVEWESLSNALDQAMRQEQPDRKQEASVAARGLSRAAALLSRQYHLVITNVPYLARGKQGGVLRDFCGKYFPAAKNDLATVFLERFLDLCNEGGSTSIVLPQNWLFLTTYRKFREKLLKNHTWHLVARLGPGAFETISGEVVKAILISISKGFWEGAQPADGKLPFSGRPHRPAGDSPHYLRGLDVSEPRTAARKAVGLRTAEIKSVQQAKQLENPDARVVLEEVGFKGYLSEFSYSYHGLTSGDMPRMKMAFWEFDHKDQGIWVSYQGTVSNTGLSGGNEFLLRWQNGRGVIDELLGARKDGTEAWGHHGVLISQMRDLPVTLYNTFAFDNNTAVIIPHNPAHLPAIWCFCSSPEYNEAVRQIDQSLKVTNATLVKVPFDLDYWTKIAEKKYPNGLPKPYSNDPTQWIFHGHPCGSVVWDEERKWTAHGPLRTDSTVLQVAVARLLGYRWPAELDNDMELADEQRKWVNKCEDLLKFADKDGIVCIPSVRGEEPAGGRLLSLLAVAYEEQSGRGFQPLDNQRQDAAATDAAATLPTTDYLDEWLRDHFFEQHCKLFHHRPFIWHIWDGRRRDGFHALVNYHKLAEGNGKGRQLLENLTYSYLGDWITRQREGVKRGEGGAEDRLAAALELQKRLIAIIEGEPPFDIFVRWKPIEEQPIGWEPDINDGIRLNIRPFMARDIPGGRKGAGILRWKPNIKWGKDRGKEPFRPKEQYPWFWKNGEFTGDRVNDVHLTNEEKRKVRRKKDEG